MGLLGVAIGPFALDVGEMDDALLNADDHGADAGYFFALAGVHIAEDDGAAIVDLDNGFRRHIVHEFGAGYLALYLFDDRDRRLCRGGRRERQ